MNVDPIERFEHDHARLTTLVMRVRDVVGAVEGDSVSADVWDELLGRLEELEEGLVAHFSREEEALFPFLRAEAPDLRGAIEALRVAHDDICARLVRLAGVVQSRGPDDDGGWRQARTLFDEFVLAYGDHARGEHDLLDRVGESLHEEQAAALRDLLRGI